MDIEKDYILFKLIKQKPINNCKDLSKNMIGKKKRFLLFYRKF